MGRERGPFIVYLPVIKFIFCCDLRFEVFFAALLRPLTLTRAEYHKQYHGDLSVIFVYGYIFQRAQIAGTKFVFSVHSVGKAGYLEIARECINCFYAAKKILTAMCKNGNRKEVLSTFIYASR